MPVRESPPVNPLIKAVETDRAPLPAGHYSQAVVHGGLVYISGQLPVVPRQPGQEILQLEAQVRQVLANLNAILKAAGSGREHVLKVTVYVADIASWPEVNRIYGEFFGPHRPARAIVPTRELHFGYQVEMDAIAAVTSA